MKVSRVLLVGFLKRHISCTAMPSWFWMNTETERALVESFIRSTKRDRWLELLLTTKGRRKLRASLAHCADFDPATIIALPSNQQHASSLFVLLTDWGAPSTYYLISEKSEWDAREMDLKSALKQVVGCGFGTIVSCQPRALAYFEGESLKDRFILRKRQER